MYSLKDIANAMHAEIHGKTDISADFRILTDSRTLTDPENSIFFALRTAHNDGHAFIDDLIQKGVNIFVVDNKYEAKVNKESTFFTVDNTLKALQDLAIFHRKKFNIPVFGITGSNGKTIVKEWLKQLLQKEYRICANPKSYNSQIGVPLSIWQLNAEHQLGIFEAGISTQGEMENLESIIQPEFGILTHLGSAHNEGFDDAEQKLNEKLKLFKQSKIVFTAWNEAVLKALDKKVLSFGFNQEAANLNVTEIKKSKGVTLIKAYYNEKTIEFSIPFTDDASIENACLCCLVCLYLDKFDAAAFARLNPVSMRMELKKGIHRCILVNDSYSNDLNALSTALSFLQQQAIHPKTTVILSDIEESGLRPEVLYRQVKNLLTEKKISRLIAVGPDYMTVQSLFSGHFETAFYPDTLSLMKDIDHLKFQDESILIKGARKFGFEKLVNKLEQESHGTVLEIDLTAALKNLSLIRSKLPSTMKIMAMVKAFAYGSGSYEIAKLLQKKVDYLAVAYTDEGVALRKNGINTPIMVMNADETVLDQLITYTLEPVIFSQKQLKAMLDIYPILPVPIHIEIDTGMHRLGFVEQDIQGLKTMLNDNSNVKVASIFSHLSASDEERYDGFTNIQFAKFITYSNDIELSLGYHPLTHISNTAAALRFDQKGLDMVRLGIGLYGIDPSGKFGDQLETVFTLKTHISQIKYIDANESIGYSRKSVSDKPRKIAVLALGYADGLNRALSNGNGSFSINRQKAAITGNVCMDMCMVDVTDIECEEGDEAILFGKDLSISALANSLNTIPYEILTSISQRVKRIYVSE